ncbi:MAG: hypothetical protein AB7S97_01700 [Thermoplasmata archaeon]
MEIVIRGVVVVALVVLMSVSAAPLSFPRGDGSSETLVSAVSSSPFEVELLCLHYVSYDDGDPPMLEVSKGVSLWSNDSALTWYHRSTYSNLTSWVSTTPGTFQRVLSAMEWEGYWSMGERYEDAFYADEEPEDYRPTYTVYASGPDSDRASVFEDKAVMGLMPETFRLMKMIGREFVVVDLSASEVSPDVYEVSLSVTNTGSENLSLNCIAPGFWPYYVVSDDGDTHQAPSAFPDCDKFVPPGATLDLSTMTFNASSLPAGSYRYFVYASTIVAYFNITVEGDGWLVDAALLVGVSALVIAAATAVVALRSRRKRRSGP